MAALVTGNQATTSVIERGLNDADAEVRRFAAAAAATDARIDERDRVIKIALADKEPRVRLEALRAWGRHFQKTSCAPIRAALKDPNPHVMLQAIDQLARGMSGGGADRRRSADDRRLAEHHAARVARARPRDRVAGARCSRMPLARRCRDSCSTRPGRCGCMPREPPARWRSIDDLNTLMTDPNDNVREAALSALIDLKRPGSRRRRDRVVDAVPTIS